MSDDKSLVPIPEMPANSDFHGQSFYKIVLPGTSTCGPSIPPSFLEHMEKEPSGVATLTVSSRSKWRIKLMKEENGIVFKDGWKRFFKENSLKLTDILFFTYHGNLQFNVDIFDRKQLKYICFPTFFSPSIYSPNYLEGNDGVFQNQSLLYCYCNMIVQYKGHNVFNIIRLIFVPFESI
ncbi:hypothetical protein Pfo_021008 [Paulownia fortunei]|nr:hypothetical protein Pfo_021008 [Paulownia fortunei]